MSPGCLDYGDQTWEEMHFSSYGVVVDDILLTHRAVVAPGGFIGGFFSIATGSIASAD